MSRQFFSSGWLKKTLRISFVARVVRIAFFFFNSTLTQRDDAARSSSSQPFNDAVQDAGGG